MNELFRKVAARVSCVLGSPAAFIVAAILVVLWAACGPYFAYSDAWQLVINTTTTVATFLMLFVLQSSQNRDTKATNIKLDELLRAIEGARNRLADLKDASDDELQELEGEFQRLAEIGRHADKVPSRRPQSPKSPGNGRARKPRPGGKSPG